MFPPHKLSSIPISKTTNLNQTPKSSSRNRKRNLALKLDNNPMRDKANEMIQNLKIQNNKMKNGNKNKEKF